jgi:hypothetical protein
MRYRPATLITVACGLLLAVAACAQPGTGVAVGAPPPVPTSPTLAPVPTTATPVTTAPTVPDAPTRVPPAAPAAPTACGANDLAFVSASTGFAMGSAYTTYTVRNSGSAACTLQGSPRLRYAANGSTATIPAAYDTGGSAFAVQPGGSASFVLREPNGHGGYDPSGPECAHPATYHQVAAILDDGSALPLGANATISIQCGQMEIAVWSH